MNEEMASQAEGGPDGKDNPRKGLTFSESSTDLYLSAPVVRTGGHGSIIINFPNEARPYSVCASALQDVVFFLNSCRIGEITIKCDAFYFVAMRGGEAWCIRRGELTEVVLGRTSRRVQMLPYEGHLTKPGARW